VGWLAVIPSVVVARRVATESKVAQLRDALAKVGADEIVGQAACVYATGSIGRSEMSDHSDLDIFIVRDESVAPTLTKLEEIRLKARLIEVSRRLGFPDFSKDGEYVKSYDVTKDLVEKLGGPDDDYTNVLTARLLLLLESRPILGEPIYHRAIDELLARYWKDYPQNSADFLPVFMTNDILRFWKTMCVNYEARTGDAETGKRRLLNYKLKYSRLLTPYSAILYLLTEVRAAGAVTPEAARTMVAETPTARLAHVAAMVPEAAERIQRVLESYATFLTTCDAAKEDLELRFSDDAFKRERFREAKTFATEVFELLHVVGDNTELLRYLVV
jgi:hypothetical protein